MSRDGTLPLGVEVSDLPGNRPEDAAWEAVHETIDRDATEQAMSDMDVEMAWRLGLAAWNAAKDAGARWPHERQEDTSPLIQPRRNEPDKKQS